MDQSNYLVGRVLLVETVVGNECLVGIQRTALCSAAGVHPTGLQEHATGLDHTHNCTGHHVLNIHEGSMVLSYHGTSLFIDITSLMLMVSYQLPYRIGRTLLIIIATTS